MLRLQEGQNFAEVGQESDYPKLKLNKCFRQVGKISQPSPKLYMRRSGWLSPGTGAPHRNFEEAI